MLFVLSDTKTLKIKNNVVFPAIGWGVLSQGVVYGWEGMKGAALGMAIPLLSLWCLYYLRLLGAGDIKAFSAIGAMMGPTFIWRTMIYSFLSGGVIAFVLILVRKNGRERLLKLYNYLKYCIFTATLSPYQDFAKNHQGHFPFAWAIALGTLITWFIPQKVDGGILWLTFQF